jgi:hypothetical protein
MVTLGLDLQTLRAIVEREQERFKVPGVEVVVVRGGEVLFAGGMPRPALATGPDHARLQSPPEAPPPG